MVKVKWKNPRCKLVVLDINSVLQKGSQESQIQKWLPSTFLFFVTVIGRSLYQLEEAKLL